MFGENKTIYILLSLVAAIMVLSGISNYLSSSLTGQEEDEQEALIVYDDKPLMDDDIEYIVQADEPPPPSINILGVGFDESGGLTDVMMVFHLDTETKQVSALSIPRDLLIDFRTDRFKNIKQNNPNNRVLYCKLNEVYSYSGWNEQALYDVQEIISIIINRDIDYMATVDISGFEQMVDAIGGVDFYVPQDMYYYDPAADFLIDLKEGQQVLDGNHALQLVRYRKSYGDLGRIEVQQDFIMATFQAIVSDIQLNELIEMATIGCSIADTDFGLIDMMDYINYLYDADFSELLNTDRFMTVPNAGEKIDGFWFQILDKEGTEEMVEELFN